MLILLLVNAIAFTAAGTPASEQLFNFKMNTMCPIGMLRTSSGAPVYVEDTSSLHSPLNTNQFFIETLAHFFRSQIYPRTNFNNGAGAFGYFKVTHNVTDICKAKLFENIGKQTPVAVRFGLQNKEGADTVRDPRGFSVKFYTEEGNFDIVTMNSPMYPIKDPILFPSLIRAMNKNPKTHLTDFTPLWDIITSRPEAAFFAMYLFSDNGTPAGYRHMPGYSIHTYQVYNNFDESHFVRFKLDPHAGIKNFCAEESLELASSNPEYSAKDLYNSIEKGDCPSWTLSMQVLSLRDVETCDFDSFDVTQIIPEDQFPWRPVGDLVLNENPKNYFADVEQLAFSPGHLVPGILGAPDKMFEARRYGYRDAASHRLGVNFNKININKPLIPVYSYLRDGAAPVRDNEGEAPNYFPNHYNGPYPFPGKNRPELVSVRNETTYNFNQAAHMYTNGMTDDAQSNMIKNIVTSLCDVDPTLQKRTIDLFCMIHPDLGHRIQSGLADTNNLH